MTQPIQVCFVTPANVDDLSDAYVHVGFVDKRHKNGFWFQYSSDGSRRYMNHSKFIIHGSLLGARATLTKLLQQRLQDTKRRVETIEYLLASDML